MNGWSLSLHPMLSVKNMSRAGSTAIQLCICKKTACCSLDMDVGRGAAPATSMLTATSVSVTSFQAPCRSLRWRRMQRLRRCHSCCLPCEAVKLSHLLDENTCLSQPRNIKGSTVHTSSCCVSCFQCLTVDRSACRASMLVAYQKLAMTTDYHQ